MLKLFPHHHFWNVFSRLLKSPIFIFPELVPYCWMTVHFYQSLRPTTAQLIFKTVRSIPFRNELRTSIPETEIPKSLIKKIYAKYYLDFVLYGFSTDSVQAIVNVGKEDTSNYSFKSKLVDEFAQYRKVMHKKQKRELNPVQFWNTLLNREIVSLSKLTNVCREKRLVTLYKYL